MERTPWPNEFNIERYQSFIKKNSVNVTHTQSEDEGEWTNFKPIPWGQHYLFFFFFPQVKWTSNTLSGLEAQRVKGCGIDNNVEVTFFKEAPVLPSPASLELVSASHPLAAALAVITSSHCTPPPMALFPTKTHPTQGIGAHRSENGKLVRKNSKGQGLCSERLLTRTFYLFILVNWNNRNESYFNEKETQGWDH